MGIKCTQHVLFDDVILFLRKNLRQQSCYDNSHESDFFNSFFESLGYAHPQTSLKNFVFDYVWRLPTDAQISKLEDAIEYLIDDDFINFIIHCSPNDNKHYASMSSFTLRTE